MVGVFIPRESKSIRNTFLFIELTRSMKPHEIEDCKHLPIGCSFFKDGKSRTN